MTNPDFPKVLFVTPCAFNKITGWGVTFSNLFRDWPQERLATVTDDPVPVSYDICARYYFLSPKERSYIKPFGWLRRVRNKLPNRTQSESSSSPEAPNFLFRTAKWTIGEAGIPDCGQVTPDLRQWIREFNPEVLYTCLGSIGYIELVEQIQQEFDLPLVIHLMDDGVTDPNKRGLFGWYIRSNYRSKFLSLFPKTSVRMAICEAMAKEYSERYGRSFIHFQNTVDFKRCLGFLSNNFQIKSPAKIVYVGSIYPFAQLQSLIDCCQAVKKINQEGSTVQLEIYTHKNLFGKYAKLLQISSEINWHNIPLEEEFLWKILAEADILLLPVNFDSKSIHFIRLSMPTKVPTYLTSGTPILVYGPAGVAQVEYAREQGWGYVVDQRDRDTIIQAIVHLIKDIDLRKKLSGKAKETAQQNHDSTKVRIAFQKTLLSAVLSQLNVRGKK
ncbi:MAG: glycosyltransferase [Xenococcaceae cyanobacterium]